MRGDVSAKSPGFVVLSLPVTPSLDPWIHKGRLRDPE